MISSGLLTSQDLMDVSKPDGIPTVAQTIETLVLVDCDEGRKNSFLAE